ncbi:class I SAM-dependent methyltransferase [Paenibacillus psychroresistens]|uniref:Class I SAM-dependent methyltransferase n=1 Tax=Paenibacillus psychroresistens TaxID=1778678 RepID=A0A6B8RW72_9BACL|nr:class I SAM-dependent methyltransferase [Paenibacillus psychroresistens]QGQ99653.1 class I SAM-dependent methyltransferase [Paenibacillus psychroresistens]
MISSLNTGLSYVMLGIVFLAMLSIVFVSWRNGISPMPSSVKVRSTVASEINRLSGTGTIVEAGSGWGTLGLHLARQCTGWKIVGLENSPVPLWISRVFLRWASTVNGISRESITFIKADIYTYPYGANDVIVCYLYPGAMKRLSEMANNRLSPGTRIISVCFALSGWEPERIVTCGDLYRTKVYVYSI